MALKGKYLDRALASKDPRFRKIAERMGGGSYDRRDMRAEDGPAVSDIAGARRDYEAVFGRKPFMGWDAATIRQRMAKRALDSDGE